MHLGLTALVDPRLQLLTDESRAFYENRTAGTSPSNAQELRAVRAARPQPAPASPPAVEELVTANGRSVALRIHTPTNGAARGVLLEIHGGGFYMGSAAAGDIRNRQLADSLGIAVASVDYRLAPEHPWPAAPNDCETAALWLAEHTERRFGTAKLAIGGFSAGATLAMTTLLRLRDRGVTAFHCAALEFGGRNPHGSPVRPAPSPPPTAHLVSRRRSRRPGTPSTNQHRIRRWCENWTNTSSPTLELNTSANQSSTGGAVVGDARSPSSLLTPRVEMRTRRTQEVVDTPQLDDPLILLGDRKTETSGVVADAFPPHRLRRMLATRGGPRRGGCRYDRQRTCRERLALTHRQESSP